MIPDALLAIGLLFSTASELRLPGLPLGPGETVLVVWIVVTLFRQIGMRDSPPAPAFFQLVIFWLTFGIALSVGTLTGYALGDVHDHELFMHDAMAYPLLAVLSCLSALGSDAGARLIRVAWILAVLGSASLVLQIAAGWGLIHVASIDPWYWDRFRGWSSNPVQLALLCTVLTLLAVCLADTATGVGWKIAALGCAIVPVYAGRLTKSDSLSVALAISIPLFVALKLRTWLRASGLQPNARSTFARFVIIALPLLLAAMVPLGSLIAVQASDLASGIAKGNAASSRQEAELRLQIWKQGINRGLESGMLGFGPGPHIEIPASIVGERKRSTFMPKGLYSPQPNGTPNFEAHNTLVDLFTQGGLLAVLAFVWIVATAFLTAYRTGLAGPATLLCGTATFGFANLIVRHPLFWFTIALCLVAGFKAAAAPDRSLR